MDWKIIDRRTIAKDAMQGTEDLDIYVSERCVAVLDGHSNVPGVRVEGLTHGQFVVQAGRRAFDAFHGDDPHMLVKALTSKVGRELARIHLNGHQRPGFVFVAFLLRSRVIVRVGDCQYLIDGEGHNPGIMPDRVKSEIRVTLLQRLLKERPLESLLVNDPTQGLMQDLKVWQHTYRNNPDPTFGYGVIDGTPVPFEKIECIPVPGSATSVVLSSDGYPPHVLRVTLDETEAELRALLREDPLCYEKWVAVRGIPWGKERPDDCAYVSLQRKAA